MKENIEINTKEDRHDRPRHDKTRPDKKNGRRKQ